MNLIANVMRVTFSAQDLDELFTELGHRTEAIVHATEYEQILELPPQCGKGWTQHGKLRAGLEFTLSCYECTEPIIFQGKLDCSSLVFKFCASGQGRSQIQSIPEECYLTQGQSSLSFLPGLVGTFECSPKQPMILLEVLISPSTLNNLINDEFEQISQELRQIAEGDDRKTYWQNRRMTQLMLDATEKILHCPFQGLTKRLYLEGLAIALIAAYLNLLSEEKIDFDPLSASLKRHEIERIHRAREILSGNLENPPSLLELARQVGLNDYKLKRGFRQVFGTTAFGYLHQQRMEQARKLLRSERLSVTEVAGTVGYTSLSSFNAAFKRRFGMNPSTCRSS